MVYLEPPSTKRRTCCIQRQCGCCVRPSAADTELDLDGPRASLLSVLVFAGPQPVTKLAELEQVSSPAMTKMVSALESAGLAQRERTETDRRVVLVSATPAGKRLLEQGKVSAECERRRLACRRYRSPAADPARGLGRYRGPAHVGPLLICAAVSRDHIRATPRRHVRAWPRSRVAGRTAALQVDRDELVKDIIPGGGGRVGCSSVLHSIVSAG